MSRNYTNKPMIKKKAKRSFKHIFWMLLGFVVGYLVGSFYNVIELQKWCWIQWQMYHSPVVSVTSSKKTASIQKPKFEFYTLLTSEGAVTSSKAPVQETQTLAKAPSVAMTQVAPPRQLTAGPQSKVTEQVAAKVTKAPTPTLHDLFVVQVASFQQLREAERLKVALLMKGFDVSITTITQNNLHWYRVNMGPFKSKQDAEKAQVTFAQRQHVVGMIRKMDS